MKAGALPDGFIESCWERWLKPGKAELAWDKMKQNPTNYSEEEKGILYIEMLGECLSRCMFG